MPVRTVTDESDLDRLLEEHEIVLLDFWAPWCPPCRGFLPVFEAAAERHAELGFCRVNADDAEGLKSGFGVKSIPTLIVIRDRIMIAEQSGYMPESALDDLIGQVKALDMDEVRRNIGQSTLPEGDGV